MKGIWWKNFLAVGLFGMVGALLRYGAGAGVQVISHSSMPFGTLAVNLSGCLLLGCFTAWAAAHPGLPVWMQTGIGTGLIGSYTTFSTFSMEMVQLLQEGRPELALVYMAVSACGGILCVWVGTWLYLSRQRAQTGGGSR